MTVDLNKYGLSERFEQEATMYADLYIARISEQHHDLYKVICEQGEISANVSGKLAYHADNQTSFPAVGDWVMIDRTDGNSGNAVIHHILRRKSVLVRHRHPVQRIQVRLLQPILILYSYACRSMRILIFAGLNDI